MSCYCFRNNQRISAALAAQMRPSGHYPSAIRDIHASVSKSKQQSCLSSCHNLITISTRQSGKLTYNINEVTRLVSQTAFRDNLNYCFWYEYLFYGFILIFEIESNDDKIGGADFNRAICFCQTNKLLCGQWPFSLFK